MSGNLLKRAMSRRNSAAAVESGKGAAPLPSLHNLCDVLSVGMYHGKHTSAASADSNPVMQNKTFFYIASLKGFLELENGVCRVQEVCDGNPDALEQVFSVATTWSPEAGRTNDWAWHVENGIKQGAADAFIQSVRDEARQIRAANSDASNAAEVDKKLADHYRKAIKQVVMHKILFGGEYVDVEKPFGFSNSIRPLGAFFFGQVAIFLSRTNGSVPALVRMVKEWKTTLPAEYVRLIPSDFMVDVFREAVRLAYDPRWNSNLQNVERAAATIKAAWDGRLNKRARIELGLEDNDLNLQFEGLSREDDDRIPEIGSKFPLTYRQLQKKVPVFDFITRRVVAGGVPSMWILSTIKNTDPRRSKLDEFFVDSGGNANDQKQFRTYTYYVLKTNGLPEDVIDRYTKFMIEFKIMYTFLQASEMKGRVSWKLVPGMKYSQTTTNRM